MSSASKVKAEVAKALGRPADKLPAGLAVSDWILLYSDGRIRGVCAGSLGAALLALGDKGQASNVVGLVRKDVLAISDVIQGRPYETAPWKCFRIINQES